MSDTPRTDARVSVWRNLNKREVIDSAADFARQLERESDARGRDADNYQKQRGQLRELNDQLHLNAESSGRTINQLRAQLLQAQAAFKVKG